MRGQQASTCSNSPPTEPAVHTADTQHNLGARATLS